MISNWIHALNKLINDEGLRVSMGMKLNAWVKENYKLDDSWQNWRDALFPQIPLD